MNKLLLLICLVPVLANAQDPRRVDSLELVLQTHRFDTLRVYALNDLAFEMVDADPSLTVSYAREAWMLSERLGYDEGVAWSLNCVGLGHDYLGNYDTAMLFYQQSVDKRNEMGDENGAAAGYLNMGASYLYQGVYQPALEYTIKALEIYTQVHNEKKIVSCLNNIGILYRAKKDYEKALKNYKEVLAIRKARKDKTGLINTYANISVVYQNLQDYENFLRYADTSLALARELESAYDIASSCINVGSAYLKLNDPAKGEKYYREALELLEDVESQTILGFCYAGYGELKLYEKKYAEANELLLEGKNIAKEKNQLELLGNIYALLAGSHKSTGDYKTALEYQELRQQLEDSLLNQENIRQLNEMDAVYKTTAKEKENEKLKSDNLFEKLKSEGLNRQRNIFIIASVIILVLLLFILKAYTNNRKTGKLLAEKNKIIEKSLFEKDTLLKEIHHRVKNNLQIISSLLELQMNRIDDPGIRELLTESKARIESMAMIHKKLYSQGNLSDIPMQEYTHELVNSLRSSYLAPGKKLEVDEQVSDFTVNVETAIPLGLIVTEVVSNALKYATRENHENRITVRLEKTDPLSFALKIQDNGPGINDSENILQKDSLGIKLVKLLSRQLKGECEFRNDHGTVFLLTGKIIG